MLPQLHRYSSQSTTEVAGKRARYAEYSTETLMEPYRTVLRTYYLDETGIAIHYDGPDDPAVLREFDNLVRSIDLAE